jgi:N-acyl-D-aspartate/D-glutamate deacylase
MLDVRICNARIVDGSGNPWFRADVGIQGGRIAAVGDLRSAGAARSLDADDRCLAPGFIDAHTHSDFSLPTFPRSESRISQGVTTEVGGNCGFSPFPVNPDRLDLLRDSSSFIASNLTWEWRSAEDFFRHMDSRALGVNFVPLVAHGAVRVAAMGFDRRPAAADEMARMKALVAEAMESGAAGLSSGLAYAPGCYAETGELVELCRVVAQYGGIYTTHMRNQDAGLLESVEESLRVGREASVPVQIAHHKAMGEAYWGRVKDSLAMVDEARRNGQDVTLDVYPYTAVSTTVTRFLPEWTLEGGVAVLLERLRTPDVRGKILQEAAADRSVKWENVLVVAMKKPEHARYEGMTLAALGAEHGKPPLEAAVDLILADGAPFSIIRFVMSEDDVVTVMRHPAVMFGSDGYAMSPALGAKPHPRSYGTFTRVLGHYVRERGVLSLEEAVRKMTSFPAARFGLWDRGLIRPGQVADLVLFDPAAIRDAATFGNPHQYSAGIDWVMVRGQLVWQEGKDTGTPAGQVLRAPGRSTAQ